MEKRVRSEEEEKEEEDDDEQAMTTTSLKIDTSNFISIGAAIQAVQELPDIDEDLLFEALDFLEKGINAAMFIAIKEKLRSKWLRKKLRPQLMEISVKTKDGKTIALNVFICTIIKELKAQLRAKETYLPTKIRLIYAGRQLEDRRSISEYGIKDGSVLHVV